MGKGAPCGADDGKAEAGAKLFKAKCATCHTCNEGGPNKQGPNLFGVIGRQSGLVSKQSKVGPARGRARPEASVARDSYRCASPPLPPRAQVAGFKYTDANKNSGVTWTTQAMFDYLANPKKYIKGTNMAFPGFKKQQDAADVTAYLKSMS